MLHPNMAKQFIEVWNRQKDKVKTRARQYSRHAFKSSLCLMTCQTWETLLAATLWLSGLYIHTSFWTIINSKDRRAVKIN